MTDAPNYKWYRDLNRYQWFVLAVCCIGWMFDSMAQQIFGLARRPALAQLLGGHASDAEINRQSGFATSAFMLGWATGGIVFGILGDRIGRVKTMVLAILFYTIFTGASVLAASVWDFNVYRFLCGIGVGGLFAVGVAMLAEVVPARARPYALGTMQSFSLVGNMVAAIINITLGFFERSGAIVHAWRYLFLAGAVPAPLALVVFFKLKEPEAWLKARGQKQKLGSYAELFSDSRWRRHAIAGLFLALAGVVGLWGIGYFSYDLFRPVLERTFRADGLTGAALAGKVTTWIGITSMCQNFGGFWGVHGFTYLTSIIGRKKAFAFSFLFAMAMTAFTFWRLNSLTDVFWVVPLMGFSQLTLFGGYSIYLPELFPTRLRSTGTSLCYNVGRGLAAAFPSSLGYLTGTVFASQPEPLRYAGISMCLVFLLGIASLPFLPETKDRPLPE